MKFKTSLFLAASTVMCVSLLAIMMCYHHSASTIVQPQSSDTPDATSLATLGAPISLERLTQKASLIIVGRVNELSSVGKISSAPSGKAQVIFATAQSDRVLKGSLAQSSLTLKFVSPPSFATTGKIITPSLYGMFFLIEESPHEYVLADGSFPSVVATKGAPLSQGNALERVINEVAYVLVSPGSSPSDQLQAVTALRSVNSPTANAALRRALGSEDQNVRIQAESGLLRHNDVAVLESLQISLFKPASGIGDDNLILSAAIRDGIRDPKAIPILSHLLSAPDNRIRQSAAHALRETHSDAAVVPLSTALNDSDQMVRYDAVLGLSEITGDMAHAPSVDLFKRDPNKYLTYWR